MFDGFKSWDRHKIESLFTTHEAEKILSIPLYEAAPEDKLVWGEDKDGVYTVRQGYRLIMMEKRGRVGDGRDSVWDKLWHVNAPPKCRHLLWRLARECVPTRTRLYQRRVNCPTHCPVCNNDAENDFHVFITCTYALDCWAAAGLAHLIVHRIHLFNALPDLLFNICSQEHPNVAGRIAVLLWYIWQHRNDVVWNSHTAPATSVGQQSLAAWQAWNMAQQQLQQQAQRRQQQVTSTEWEKPREGWFKCNVDAGFSSNKGITTTAACLRSSSGVLICAQARKYNAKMPTLEGEGLALLDAVTLMQMQGLNFVIFESDSQTLVNSITSCNNHHGSSEFSSIITRIRLLLDSLANFEIKFVRRQANMAAHTLARAAISWSCHRFFDFIPPCIVTLINNEMS